MVKWFIGARFAAFLLTRNSSFTTRKTRTECFRTRVSYIASFIACCICFMQTAMNEWKHEWRSLAHTSLRTPGTHSSHVRGGGGGGGLVLQHHLTMTYSFLAIGQQHEFTCGWLVPLLCTSRQCTMQRLYSLTVRTVRSKLYVDYSWSINS